MLEPSTNPSQKRMGEPQCSQSHDTIAFEHYLSDQDVSRTGSSTSAGHPIDGAKTTRVELQNNLSEEEAVIGTFVNSITGKEDNYDDVVVFVEDDEDGRAGVMVVEEAGKGEAKDVSASRSSSLFQSRRIRYFRKFCLFFGSIFVLVLFSVGLAASKKSSESNEAVDNAVDPSSPKKNPPPPVSQEGQNISFELRPRSNDLLYPPTRVTCQGCPQGLPDLVTGFGHVLTVSGDGGYMMVAAHSHQERGYHSFNWSTATNQWVWLKHQDPPQEYSNGFDETTQENHHHHQSIVLSSNGESVAFSDNGKGFVQYPYTNDSLIVYHMNVENTSPNQQWYTYQVAMSSSGQRAAVLAADLNSDDGNEQGSSVVQVFQKTAVQVQSGAANIWERVDHISLPTKVSGGSLAFDSLGQVLAVGTYTTNDDNVTEESFRIYESTNESGSWIKLGFPIKAAKRWLDPGQRLGGGVLSLSSNGAHLAVGSHGGALNHVVMMRHDYQGAAFYKWRRFGKNNILKGSDYSTENFGASVVLRGSRLFVGAPGNLENASLGKVFVFEYSRLTDTWSLVAQPVQSTVFGDKFGSALALDTTGTLLTVGIPHRHRVEAGANYSTTGAIATYHLVQTSN